MWLVNGAGNKKKKKQEKLLTISRTNAFCDLVQEAEELRKIWEKENY